jgi:hypothetical protein
MTTSPSIHHRGLSQLPKSQLLTETKLVARGLNVVFGPSGSYKSFYMLDQALRIAQSERVLYVAAEGASGLESRLNSWAEHNKKEAGDLWFIPEEVNLLEDPAPFVKMRQKEFKDKQPVLIVFDTYARCMIGGDENSSKDAGIAIQNCAKIQRALGSAITLIHHTSKAGYSERGSTALRGAADLMIEIMNEEGRIQVKCSKAKDTKQWASELFYFRELNGSGVLIPGERPAETILSPSEIEILRILALSVFEEAGATTRQLATSLNVPERSLYRLLSNLKSRCLVHQSKKGDPYYLSDMGKYALETMQLSSGILDPNLFGDDSLENLLP